MKYIYSATFSVAEDGAKVFARVPDLPGCITTGADLRDAIEQITDAASCWLVVAEDEGIPIPAATAQADLAHDDGCSFSMIAVDTLAYRAATDSRAVRKNVSLPAWMASLADKRGLNCSQLLQDAITARLSAN